MLEAGIKGQLTIRKIPCFLIKTLFAVMSASGHKQRHPHARAILNRTGFDLRIVHLLFLLFPGSAGFPDH